MSTTTIRVEKSVHERLLLIGRESDRALVDVIADATEALERARFAENVRTEMDRLRANPVAWKSYVLEFGAAVSDGLTNGSSDNSDGFA
jgi:hypothetical protein